MTTNWITERLAMVNAALGKEPLDLLIQNTRVVNVFNREIFAGNIGIKCGHVVTLQASPDAETAETYDADGKYALPGLIDTHVHIDSTLLTAEGLVELIVPHGTTAVFADPMEISNVAGYKGLEALFSNTRSLPCHFYLEVPSRVPTAPGLETTGGELGLAEVEKLLNWEECVSLGELDPSKVLGLKKEYFGKLETAFSQGKIANGHTAGLSGTDLIAYACAGLSDDHECVTIQEAQERMALGLSILIREGSTERNLEALVTGILREKIDTRNWMMCTDDKHPNEMLHEGHIDYMVNKAISLGMPPVQAIQMATLNAAAHFRMDHEIGSIAPGKCADILLTRHLKPVQVDQVFFKGKLVAEKGKLLSRPQPGAYPSWLRRTVTVKSGTRAIDFQLKTDQPQAAVRVIEILPDQIVNKAAKAILPAPHGYVETAPSKDILKLAVVERYGKNGNIGVTFVHGFGLKKGAISSTVSHDHHNIVIAGADDASMATCVRATRDMQGGFVVAVGEEVIARLPLPLGGLQSDRPPEEVITMLEALNQAAHSLGCPLPAPFMSLSFISLPTVPELGLTDMGLVDVRKHALISPFI